ncbi:hypothetical protein DFJ73DRAFT_816364 [Zopfochytrium polystomum]|nr:hypothetical protein DFJ73DRAFT_816364 [Zopfochytrium polystomum]
MNQETFTTLALNAGGTGAAGMAILVVLINCYNQQNYNMELHTRYLGYLIAVFIGMLSNVLTIQTTNSGHCVGAWSRMNNIAWGFTKVLFTEVAWIRFEMVTASYPTAARIAVRVFSALWYFSWLAVIQFKSSFVDDCQMIYELYPLYPMYVYQLVADAIATARFMFVLYSLRKRRGEVTVISLVIDLCVLATMVASMTEVIILLTELPKPLAEIDFPRILFSGTSNFIVTGGLYCILSVFSKLDKEQKPGNGSSANNKLKLPTSTMGKSVETSSEKERV